MTKSGTGRRISRQFLYNGYKLCNQSYKNDLELTWALTIAFPVFLSTRRIAAKLFQSWWHCRLHTFILGKLFLFPRHPVYRNSEIKNDKSKFTVIILTVFFNSKLFINFIYKYIWNELTLTLSTYKIIIKSPDVRSTSTMCLIQKTFRVDKFLIFSADSWKKKISLGIVLAFQTFISVEFLDDAEAVVHIENFGFKLFRNFGNGLILMVYS